MHRPRAWPTSRRGRSATTSCTSPTGSPLCWPPLVSRYPRRSMEWTSWLGWAVNGPPRPVTATCIGWRRALRRQVAELQARPCALAVFDPSPRPALLAPDHKPGNRPPLGPVPGQRQAGAALAPGWPPGLRPIESPAPRNQLASGLRRTPVVGKPICGENGSITRPLRSPTPGHAGHMSPPSARLSATKEVNTRARCSR